MTTLLWADGFDLLPDSSIPSYLTGTGWEGVRSGLQRVAARHAIGFAIEHPDTEGGIRFQFPEQDGVTLGFAFRFRGTPVEGHICRLLYTDGVNSFPFLNLVRLTTGALNITGTGVGTQTPTVVGLIRQDEWHYVELSFVKGSPNRVEVRVDLRLAGSWSYTQGDLTLNGFTLRGVNGNEHAFDDVYLLSRPANTLAAYLGDVRVEARVPFQNGYDSDFSIVGNASQNWRAVSVTNNNRDNAYVSARGVDFRDFYRIKGPTGDPDVLLGVNLLARCRRGADTTSATLSFRVRFPGQSGQVIGNVSPSTSFGTVHVAELFTPSGDRWNGKSFPDAELGYRVTTLTGTEPILDVSMFEVRLLVQNYPDFSWLEDEMFLEDAIFPYDISYESDGAEVFSTRVSTTDSGHDQRIGYWDQPLMEYNVAYGVRTMEQLHALKRLFRVVKGQQHGFRFRDPVDFTSSFAVGVESREPEPITAVDQLIGIGDGSRFSFQLVKTYDAGGEDAVRIIRKPEVGSVLVALDGVTQSSSTYDVDHTTGMVTFTGSGGSVTLSDAEMIRGSGRVRSIEWTGSQSFTGIAVNDRVQISGFALRENRITEKEPWRVTNIDNTGKTITFEIPVPYSTVPGVNETAPGDIRIRHVISPGDGVEVTAGYRFHVPVRFQTDRLPIRLETYGIGSATEVKLVEVRSKDE
jgi:uncharacterized protein (TIGR02217 family)